MTPKEIRAELKQINREIADSLRAYVRTRKAKLEYEDAKAALKALKKKHAAKTKGCLR